MIPELEKPLRREFSIESVGAADTRTVEAVLSTDTPLSRWGITEILSHDSASVDLSRAERGLPLLWNHESAKPIGKVRNLRLQDGKLRGTLQFSANPEAAWVWQDVRDGFLDDVSIGYSVSKWEIGGDDTEYTARRWEILEASVVTVPADKAAGMHRSFNFGDRQMSDDSTTPEMGAGSNDGAKVVEVSKASFNRGKTEGKKAALGELQARVRAINELFDQYLAMFPDNQELRGLHMDLITAGSTLDQARAALLAAMPSYLAEPTGAGFTQPENAQRAAPSTPPSRPAQSVRDEVETIGNLIETTLLHRCDIGRDADTDRKLRESGIGGLSFVELGRRFLETTNRGSEVRSLDKHGIAKVMLMRAGPMTHSDFPYLLANVATKIAKKGYTEANTTYQNWCNIDFLPDFKPATIPGLGAFSDLDLIPTAGAHYVYGTMGESGETATLATYGKLFGISRQAIVNDDLMQFRRAGLAMGAAAARKVNNLAYAILDTGQTMTETSTTLWSAATHVNFVDSGGALTVATLNAGELAMAKQTSPKISTDSSTVYLNIVPGHLVVPVSAKATAMALVESMYDPAGTAGTLPPNPWRGRLTVTADARLDAGTTATAWFLIAPKGNSTIDTVTVFFLEGSNGEPYIEEENQFTSDGITYKVRIDAVARALDYRGLYRNDGG